MADPNAILDDAYGREPFKLRYAGPDVPTSRGASSAPLRPLELLGNKLGHGEDQFDVGKILTPLMLDMILGSAGGVKPNPQTYASSRPESVFPNHLFWDKYGSSDPAWQDRVGQAQAAVTNVLNAIGFGAPMAAMRRFAPETAKSLDDVSKSHEKTAMGADIAGTLGNPMNSLYRMGGDALAKRGYGLMAQGAADAGSAAGLYGLPGFAQYGDVTGGAGAIPVAAATRVMMPRLPESVLARMAYGAGAGGLTGLAQAPTNEMAPIYYGAAGALHGAGLKRSPSEPLPPKRYGVTDWGPEREKLLNALQLGGAMGTGATIGKVGWMLATAPGASPQWPTDPNAP